MVAFIYRCPKTGLNVQGFTADDPTNDMTSYEPTTCSICTGLHLVNPANGKVLGADDDRPSIT
jgi:hypothetical protein